MPRRRPRAGVQARGERHGGVLARAPEEEGSVRWEGLSQEERRLLAPYRQQWNKFSPEYRERLREGARRYQRLSPEEREKALRGGASTTSG